MFDSTGLFHFTVYDKPCLVRWPTDAEWCERSRRDKQVKTILSGGRTTIKYPDAERLDGELFAKIRDTERGGNELFEDADAGVVIELLKWTEVEASCKAQHQFEINLRVFGPQSDPSERPLTTHIVSMPSRKELMVHGEKAVNFMQTRREVIARVALEPTGDLYDKHLISVSGYADGIPVPIIHKDAVMTEIIQLLNERGVDYDPER